MSFDNKDLKYVTWKLASSREIIKKLMEEESDMDLLLSQVAIKKIRKEDSQKVSPLVYIKLITFRYSHDSSFDVNEKDYIAKTIYTYYPSIKNSYDYSLINSGKLSEKKSQYLLILAGLFYEKFPIKVLYPNHIKEIEEGFKIEPNLRPISEHVSSWIDILREINKKRWLDSVNINSEKSKTLIYKPVAV